MSIEKFNLIKIKDIEYICQNCGWLIVISTDHKGDIKKFHKCKKSKIKGEMK